MLRQTILSHLPQPNFVAPKARHGGERQANLALLETYQGGAARRRGRGDRWLVLGALWGVLTLLPGVARAQNVLDAPEQGANGDVYAVALQADGKIVVGGFFTELGGQARSRIGQFNADGTLDSSFINPGAGGGVYTVALQTDGKIVVGGEFTELGGQPRSRIGRLNADGTLDSSFNPGASGSPFTSVRVLAVQADGKIVVGGSFTQLGGQARSGIGRLNADGTLDTSFIDPGANNSVSALAVQADGKIVVGGFFTTLGGQPRNNIGRLNADGTLDTSFNPGANNQVSALAVQADGKIVVGGGFSQLGGQARSGIGRLNADGTPDTSFNPGASGGVAAIALQADGKILVGGGFSQLGGQARSRIGRLNADGTLDISFNSGANVSVYALAVQADGKIMVGGGFSLLGGQARSRIGRLNPNGAPDTSFRSPGADYFVEALAVQADGKIVVGGQFSLLGEQARRAIGRFNADGTLDTSFIDPQANGSVLALTVQADGKIVLGGGFFFLGGQFRHNIGRLNADGTLDTSFINPGAGGNFPSVRALAVQSDGKILIGGGFTQLGGQFRNYIGRLNADGTLDTSFNPGASGGSPFTTVDALAVQADGKIVLGGNFTQLSGQFRNNIGRLNADGTLDTSFNPGASGGSGSFVVVTALTVQADGKILVGGDFTQLGGQARSRIGRLNANGTLDTSFNPGVSSGGFPNVRALALQADGKILVGGSFTGLGIQARNNIGRLNADGTLDISFNPGANNVILALAVQADGKIVAGGNFTQLGGQSRNRIGRLNPDGTLFLGNNAPAAANIVSRKTHGVSGTFDIDLLSSLTECRTGGAGGNYQVVAGFANPVTVGGLTITSSDGMASGTASVIGTMVTIDLSAVANAQTLGITLIGVSNGTNAGDVPISMGVLVGDTNSDRFVNAGDALQTRSRSGQAADASNFRSDVNAEGFVNSGDTTIVRSQSGAALP